MYSPLNEDYMFQEMRDRTTNLTRSRKPEVAARAGRRWWRRGADTGQHRAG